MKQKTITTDKATLLVVEMPEGAKFIRIETNQAVVPYGQEVNYEVPATKESYGYEETEGFALPEGNWQLLGRIPDITEGQFEKIVEFGDQEPGNDKYILKWKDYEVANVGDECPYMDYSLDTATESFYSLLQANEVYFENCLGEEPKITSGEYDNNGFGDIDKKEDLKSWKEAQKNVWDKERCYILTKVD